MFLVSALAAAGAALLATSAPVAAPGSASATPEFPGREYFNVGCGFSHRNNDDAIVFPNEPGRSHNHTYLGNRRVDAATTPASLLGGRTTCEVETDASAYWVPTLYVGDDPVHPLVGIAYYLKRTTAAVSTIPPGLKAIGGNADAKRPQPKDTVSWSCAGLGGKPRFQVIPACRDDQSLQLRVNFPNCWNGTDLDSADHRSHLKYASRGRCPATHPVALPTLVLIVLYPSVPKGSQVSSGKFGAHADFMNGWDQEELDRLVAGLNR